MNTNNTKSKPNVIELLDSIGFSPDNVVGAAAGQTGLFVKAINYRLACLQDKTRQDMDCKRISAEQELKIRKEAKANDEKLTESHIKSLLLVNKTVVASETQLAQAEAYDEYSKLVIEAFRMRRDCLKIVSENSRTEFYASGRTLDAEVEAERLAVLRQRTRERFPG
jgi:hypothetical protein